MSEAELELVIGKAFDDAGLKYGVVMDNAGSTYAHETKVDAADLAYQLSRRLAAALAARQGEGRACPGCNGKGEQYRHMDYGEGAWVRCPLCNGSRIARVTETTERSER